AHACRFLGDIFLSVHEDQERAEGLFDRALAAARQMDPWTLARTLLYAGWAPNAQGDLNGAKAMFEEALEVARSNEEGDPWAEARALVQLAVVTSPVEDARECERLAREALAIGMKTDDAFTIAVASVHVASSLRRQLRLDEAREPIDRAVSVFRELDARWELADALTGRGGIHRFSG